jgi:hypothetical protein
MKRHSWHNVSRLSGVVLVTLLYWIPSLFPVTAQPAPDPILMEASHKLWIWDSPDLPPAEVIGVIGALRPKIRKCTALSVT